MISTIAIAVIVLVGAWGADRWIRRRTWGGKSTEELFGILSSAEWRKWELALEELRRRGQDAPRGIATTASRLLSELKWERAAARIVLMNLYPEMRPLLKSYRAADDEATRQRALEPFFAKYNLGEGQGAV